MDQLDRALSEDGLVGLISKTSHDNQVALGVNMKKILIVGFVLMLSGAKAQNRSEEKIKDSNESNFSNEKSAFIFSLERAEQNKISFDGGSQDLNYDSDGYGLNLGALFEVGISGGKAFTATIPNLSYSSYESTFSSGRDFERSLLTLKVNQSIGLNFESGSDLIRPYIIGGVGYSFQETQYPGLQNVEQNIEGLVYELGIGLQWKTGNFAPFLQYLQRRQNISSVELDGGGIFRSSSTSVDNQYFEVGVFNLGMAYFF